MATARRDSATLEETTDNSAPDSRAITVRIQAYGTCTVEVDGVRLGRNADVVITLLLLLVHAPRMQLPREAITGLLWPNSAEKRKRGNLRQTLYKLRGMGIHAAMNGEQVEIDAGQVEPTFSVRRDGASFQAEVVSGHEPFGPFLLGFDAGDNSLLADWVENERERAHSDARRVVAAALRNRHAVADWVAAEPLARWLLQLDPLNEAATMVMAECLVLSGAKLDAIRLLDRYMNELGPGAGDLRIPASTLRRRIAAPAARRISFAPSERHFVGRESVMADLTLCMRRARYRDGTATLLHGPAGMGKTRVLQELAKVALIEGVQDLRCSSRETDSNRPLSVFLDLVPELLQVPGALGCSPESLQALRRFTNEDGANSDRSSSGTAMMPMAAGLRRSVVDLIAAISEEKPVLLTIEDAHWLDAASWEVVVNLIDRLGQMRVCLILTSRLPHARPAAPERVPMQLAVKALAPLSIESCLELANAIGTDLSASFDEDLGEWFVHTSEGVPLFLRSLVNHWIETGDAGGIPPTLLGVIGQRVQNLSSDALHVLQTVALLGRHADLTMIESVLELPYFRIVSAIDDLHKAGAFDSDSDGIIVCHELIGRMAVDSLGRNARRSLHKRIADVMGRANSAPVSPVRTRDRLNHLLQAGDNALFLSASAQAIRELLEVGYSYDALGVAEFALMHAPDPISRKQILTLQAEALYYCREYTKLLSHSLSPSTLGEGMSFWEREDPGALLRWIESASYADKCSNSTELAAAATLISESAHQTESVRVVAAGLAIRLAGDTCDAALAQRAYDAGKRSVLHIAESAQHSDELDMYFHTVFGTSAIATTSALRNMERASKIQNVPERLSKQLRIAFALRYSGQVTEAESLLKHIHFTALSESMGSRYYFASWRLSHLYLDFGELQMAESWLDEFAAIAPVEKEPLAAMLLNGHRVRIALARLDVDKAEYYLLKAREALPERAHFVRYATTLAQRLAVARISGDLCHMESMLQDALQLYAKTRCVIGQSFFANEIALCLVAMGQEEHARAHLADYLSIYRREPLPLPYFINDSIEKLAVVYSRRKT